MALGRKTGGRQKGTPNKARLPLAESARLLAVPERERDAKGRLRDNWARPEKGSSSDVLEQAMRLYPLIQKAYDNKQEQIDQIEEYWNIYNCKPDYNQQYTGNSSGYVGVVRDAVNARTKRALHQLFPTSHRHVEALGSQPHTPFAQLALLEHYIRRASLRDLVRTDLVAGDVTGQWNLYCDWTKSYRTITQLIRQPKVLRNDELAGGVDIEIDDGEGEEEVEEVDIETEGPDIVPFATEDLAVVPPTVNSLDKADCVALKLRLSKDKCQQLIDEGVFVGFDAEELVRRFAQPDGAREKKNPDKSRTNDAGIRTEGTYKYALIYEAFAYLRFAAGERKRAALIYFAGPHEVLGLIQAPWWGGRCPHLSAPVDKQSGSFFGQSRIEPVKFNQWNLNDYWNMGMDSAQYALLPIVMTDPLKNPAWQTMVIGLAAIWATDPNTTKFQQFPALYKDAMQLVDGIKRQIWESMDVNDLMMGRMPAGRKNNQLMGQLQQEAMQNIMDHAERYESAMLNPLLERMMEYDRQFRTETLTVQTQGELGTRARLTEVPPQGFEETYQYHWTGTAQVSSVQLLQQRIGAMNVLRGIPPQQLGRRRLDVGPVAEALVEALWGPELAARILVDESNLYSVEPDTENQMLDQNLAVEVHEADNHPQHLQSHLARLLTTQFPLAYRAHIAAHQQALMQARLKQMALMAQMQKGAPGVPAGIPPPGVSGTPRPGALAQPGRPGQNPPGAIGPDQMPGLPGRG